MCGESISREREGGIVNGGVCRERNGLDTLIVGESNASSTSFHVEITNVVTGAVGNSDDFECGRGIWLGSIEVARLSSIRNDVDDVEKCGTVDGIRIHLHENERLHAGGTREGGDGEENEEGNCESGHGGAF